MKSGFFSIFFPSFNLTQDRVSVRTLRIRPRPIRCAGLKQIDLDINWGLPAHVRVLPSAMKYFLPKKSSKTITRDHIFYLMGLARLSSLSRDPSSRNEAAPGAWIRAGEWSESGR